MAVKYGELGLSCVSLSVVKDVDTEKRELRIIGSTEEVDRDGDIVRVGGWNLDQYRKNPVFLWAHDYGSVPLGAGRKIVKVKNPSPALEFIIRFPKKGINPFADMILDLYNERIINASSVGFKPSKWRDLTKDDYGVGYTGMLGREFTHQELLELSGCAVPANPSALQHMFTDFSEKDFRKLVNKMTKYIDVAEVEDQYKDTDPLFTIIDLGGKSNAQGSETKGISKEETGKQETQEEKEVKDGIQAKKVMPYKKYEIIDEAWDSGKARKNMAEFCASDNGMDFSKYASFFAYVEEGKESVLGGYKLPHHDVKDGSMVTNIRGVMAAMGALNGARADMDLTDEEKNAIYTHLKKHYEDADAEAPELRIYNDPVYVEDIIDRCLGEVKQIKEEVLEIRAIVKARLEGFRQESKLDQIYSRLSNIKV